MRGSAILFGFLLMAGCGGPSTSTDRRTIIDSRDNYDPRSLDPALSTDVPTGRAVAYVFDGLTRFTPEARVEPALAERWDVSPDGARYVFHLRSGVSFTDGTPMSARLVVSSWTRALDPKTKGGAAQALQPIRGAAEFADGKATTVTGLSAPDDSTVVVQLAQPLGIFPKLLAMPAAAIVPPNMSADKPVGTGPWRLVQWKHDDYLLFVRNDKYWGGAPKSDSLMARIIAEPSTGVAEFESGSVDVLRIPEGDVSVWQDDESKKDMLQSVPALILVYIGMNTTRGPLKDPRVRQAINLAIDRRLILQRLVSGRGRLAAGVIPPSLDGADTLRAPYPYDTLRARQLLREAGFPNGIDIDLWVGSNPVYGRIAETAQAYLKVVGIRAKIVQRESAAAREAARKGQADMILKDWYADYPDAENFLYPLLHSTNAGPGGNVSFFANADFDRVVDAARREPDEAKRTTLYRQADSLAFLQAPMVFLWFYTELYAVQPWISGFKAPVIFNGQRWLDVSLVRRP
ncbi:MAG TPA: ABC transporter substrate-binding protein [Gemmatimonadaceae bacterium]|nr:ABC transporter substrate-binding protein [Gemmatimonadaceae bacterium]